VVIVPLGNKKEEPVVETWILSFKNNVIHPVIVTIMVALYLEHVVNESHNKFNNHIKYNKLAVPVQMIVMEIITIAYSPLMDPLTAAFAFLGNLKEELVVEAHLRCIKDNVILR
jgi:hypothetical protein